MTMAHLTSETCPATSTHESIATQIRHLESSQLASDLPQLSDEEDLSSHLTRLVKVVHDFEELEIHWDTEDVDSERVVVAEMSRIPEQRRVTVRKLQGAFECGVLRGPTVGGPVARLTSGRLSPRCERKAQVMAVRMCQVLSR